MDDDDWDVAPIKLPTTSSNANHFSDEAEEVELEEVKTKETSKPKKPVDEQQALLKGKGLSKQKQKERDEELAREAERARHAKPMTEEEKASERARIQKLQEEADAEVMNDLYGTKSTNPSTTEDLSASDAAKKRDGVQDLNFLKDMFASLDLSTTKHQNDLAMALSTRIEFIPKKSAVLFLKEVLRNSCVSLSDEDVTELTNVLNVIKNEKMKAKQNKNKKPAQKPKLNAYGLDNPGGDRYDMDDVDAKGKRGGYSAFDDGDFM